MESSLSRQKGHREEAAGVPECDVDSFCDLLSFFLDYEFEYASAFFSFMESDYLFENKI